MEDEKVNILSNSERNETKNWVRADIEDSKDGSQGTTTKEESDCVKEKNYPSLSSQSPVTQGRAVTI